MRINRAVFVMVAALSAAACGGTNHPNTLIAREVPAVVYFENASSEQAAVYAVSGGESRRIGTVFAGRLEKLRVPASMVARGSVTIFARLLARNEQPESGAIAIRPGSAYEVTLLPDRRTMTVLPGVPESDR